MGGLVEDFSYTVCEQPDRKRKGGTMYSRREFGKTALAGLSMAMLRVSPLAADPQSDATVRGVKLGGITGAYGPFNAAPDQDVIDVVIQQSIEAGAGHVELVNSVVEPPLGGPCG